MGYRGRLIRPGLAEIARYATKATADFDPAGPDTSGFDPDFKETVLAAPAPAEQVGEDSRQVLETIRIPCQQELDEIEKQGQVAQGNSPQSAVNLVFHRRYFERNGLLDATTGLPKLNDNDQLLAIYTLRGKLVTKFHDRPGLWAREVRPYGVGLGGFSNLVLVSWEALDLGVKS